MICVPIQGPSFLEASNQIQEALLIADLLEFRLDYFKLNINELSKIRSQVSIPLIFTLKGKLDIEVLQQMMELKPEYVDIDISSPSSIIECLFRYPKTKRILSCHDFLKTPENLEEIEAKMRKTSAHFYKIAVMTANCLDLAKILSLAKRSDGRLIAIGMGEQGAQSRILAKMIGSPITYAAFKQGEESAPGQLLASDLLKQYRYRSLNAETKVYGLIGSPVALSISDKTHNHWMQAQGLNAVYIKIQVEAEELGKFLDFCRKFPFSGLSVTMPLKEKVLKFLDAIDEDARQIGAVNTLVIENGKIKGFNTDGFGALNALETRGSVKGKKLLLLGAGGASRAIAYEAKKRGAEVVILNRSVDKALQMAENLGCRGGALEEMPRYFESGYEILINCTPVPLPISPDHIHHRAIVMDIVTRPKETLFLKAAKERGCMIVHGYEMFLEQALGQFHLWFDKSDGRDSLEQTALSCLE